MTSRAVAPPSSTPEAVGNGVPGAPATSPFEFMEIQQSSDHETEDQPLFDLEFGLMKDEPFRQVLMPLFRVDEAKLLCINTPGEGPRYSDFLFFTEKNRLGMRYLFEEDRAILVEDRPATQGATDIHYDCSGKPFSKARQCATCGAAGSADKPLSPCRGYYDAGYCSADCQERDWEQHGVRGETSDWKDHGTRDGKTRDGGEV